MTDELLGALFLMGRAEAGFSFRDAVNATDRKVAGLVQQQHRVLIRLHLHHSALHPNHRHQQRAGFPRTQPPYTGLYVRNFTNFVFHFAQRGKNKNTTYILTYVLWKDIFSRWSTQ